MTSESESAFLVFMLVLVPCSLVLEHDRGGEGVFGDSFRLTGDEMREFRPGVQRAVEADRGG